MNTRKIVFSFLPVIIVILIALGGLLYFVFNVSNGPAATEVPAEQVNQEQNEPPAVLTPEGEQPAAADAPVQPAPQDGKPRVIYENQQEE